VAEKKIDIKTTTRSALTVLEREEKAELRFDARGDGGKLFK